VRAAGISSGGSFLPAYCGIGSEEGGGALRMMERLTEDYGLRQKTFGDQGSFAVPQSYQRTPGFRSPPGLDTEDLPPYRATKEGKSWT
jgi:hypothetical protein